MSGAQQLPSRHSATPEHGCQQALCAQLCGQQSACPPTCPLALSALFTLPHVQLLTWAGMQRELSTLCPAQLLSCACVRRMFFTPSPAQLMTWADVQRELFTPGHAQLLTRACVQRMLIAHHHRKAGLIRHNHRAGVVGDFAFPGSIRVAGSRLDPAYVQAHAWCMTVVFAFIFPTGIIWARYSRVRPLVKRCGICIHLPHRPHLGPLVQGVYTCLEVQDS